MWMKPIYSDTDSVNQYDMNTEEREYLKNDVLTTKAMLNSIYGKGAYHMMNNREFIVVHRAKKPIIIFKKSIRAVECDNDNTATIHCSDDVTFYVDEKYRDVIKQLI